MILKDDATRDRRSQRSIRSFVRRAGRITKAQQRALTMLLPRYGVAPGDGPLDVRALCPDGADVVIDIGFGDGEALAELARSHPQLCYLGIEVYEPGIGHLLLRLAADDIDNVRVLCADAAEVFSDRLAAGSAAAVNLFFPDPWPKKRHFKRRLIQPAFVADVVRVLQPNGLLHIATDWQPYAEHVRNVMAGCLELAPVAATELVADPRAARPPTKFEHRGRALGHAVTDLFYRKR
jgi:tRNA (guanine-N7-)-methyltransferase